jgi:hypothetical protein
MASRDLDHAVESVRRAAAAITTGRFTDFRDGPTSYTLRFPRPAPLRAFGPLRGSRLNASISFKLDPVSGEVSASSVAVSSYLYALLDRDEREVLAWHWQPGDLFAGPDHPHLHVSAAVRFPNARGQAAAVDLDKRHLPTGLVSFAAVVRMLVEEFDVEPRAADWQARLAADLA